MYIIRNLILSIFLFSLTACADDIDKSKSLIVGISPDYPPFESMKNGEVIGFDVDLVKSISSKMNKKLVIKEMEFGSLIPSLNAGKIDIAISGLTNNDNRSENVSFSTPYFQVNLAAIFNKSEPITLIDEMHGKRIGVQTGSTLEDYAKGIPDTKIISMDNNLQIIQELILKRIDIMLCESSQAPEFIKRYDLSYKTFGDLEAEYSIALKKNNPLTDEVNKVLQDLKNEGYLKQLHKKWFSK